MFIGGTLGFGTLGTMLVLTTKHYIHENASVSPFKNHNEEAEKVAEIISFVRNGGGMDYAKSQMEDYQNQALAILSEFPEHGSRDALEQLIRFTTERKK
jgi:octaprenyl-diphosphate synthase